MSQKLKPKLSLVKCHADRVGIGVTNCDNYILKDHYGDSFSNDGSYALCDRHAIDLNKKYWFKQEGSS